MKNIAYQTSLFKTRRENSHKEYRDFIDHLDFVDQILTSSGIEFEFVEYYFEQLKANTASAGILTFKLTSKQCKRYVQYAIQALRCNYMVRERSWSCREAAFTIAASEELQRFIFAGDFTYAKCPGKTKINDFNSIVPGDFIRRINDSLLMQFSDAAKIENYGLNNPLDVKTLWLDGTCLEANIHFPVDWVLLRDAVRTLIKAIICCRKHGLKHRIPAPQSFISQINSLCMEMANCRRRKDASKKRKAALRKMKKIVEIVRKHAKRYRDLLHTNRDKTDLSEKEAAQILKRFNNILEKLPAAVKQAHKRIITGLKVDKDEKVLSFYDDTAAAIVRGKSGAEVEFGNELFIAEQADGFICDWHLYEHKVADQQKLRDFNDRISKSDIQLETVVGDRGFCGKRNTDSLAKNKIRNHLCPKSPVQYIEQAQEPEFVENQKRRSQTEGRIAAVKRFIGAKLPCRDFEFKQKHTAWAVLSHNLHLLARMIVAARAETEATVKVA